MGLVVIALAFSKSRVELIASFFISGIISLMIAFNMTGAGVNATWYLRSIYLLFILVFIFYFRQHGFSKYTIKYTSLRFVLILFAIVFLSIVFITHDKTYIMSFINHILIQVIIPVLIVSIILNWPNISRNLLLQWVVNWSFMISVITITLQLIENKPLFDPSFYTSIEVFPIDVARTLSISAIISIYLISKKHNQWFNRLMLLLNTYNLIQCGSRQGLQILLIVLLLWYILLNIFNQRIPFTKKLLIIFITLIVGGSMNSVISEYTRIINNTKYGYSFGLFDDGSINYRVEMLLPGLKLFILNPLGIGVNNFTDYASTVGLTRNWLGKNSLHSLYLIIIIELGIPGILVFLYYGLISARKSIILLFKGNETFNYATLIFIYMIAVSFVGVKLNTSAMFFISIAFVEYEFNRLIEPPVGKK